MSPLDFALRSCLATASILAPLVSIAQDADSRRPAAIEVAEVPLVPADVFARLREYGHVRQAAFLGWAPDGSGILISTRFGNATQLHRVFQPGGRRDQVTFFDEPVRGGFIPNADDNAMLLSMSSGGNENYQVYYLNPASHRSVLLTDGKSRNRADVVRHDGGQMIVASTQRNGRDTDLYLADPRKKNSMTMLFPTDAEYWYAADWSNDGKTLLLGRYVSINESYFAVLDIASRKRTDIELPDGGPAAIGDLQFSPDARTVYITTDAIGEFRRLGRYDLASGNYQWLTNDIDWDVRDLIVERESGLVAFTANADGASRLYLLKGDERRELKIPLGIVAGLEFSPDGEHLGFSLARPAAPTDAYSLRLSDSALTRWTFSEVGGLDPERFVTPTRVQFESFDGRDIPAYYFRSREASADRPAAVLINIHGGPESQYRPYFSSSTQYYVNELGLAVISPNVRGSAGYGKTYLKLDNAELRENSVRDIGALLDWVAQQPELDSSRIAVAGGSYGGYMVLASLEHFGDRIKAGIDIVGIANFITFLENTAAYRRDLRRAEYGDERDPAMRAVFERINPTANADKIRSALLVAHGKNDPRVPFSEAVQIANEVRERGRTVWTVYAENEGHGFAKKDNADYLRAVQALFLRRQLLP
jgi:dipeptidyl aminopeptidase/acylaminoacyl peptidase